jgi:hypothetical protein
VIDRARARGELGRSPVPGAVLAMPGALIRYHLIAKRAAPSDQAIEEIVTPLVRHHASA